MTHRTQKHRFPLAGALTLAAALTAAHGCGRPAASGDSGPLGTVAVIDLDRVAQQLGQDRQITQSLQLHQGSLQKQLEELAAAYDQQLAKQREKAEAGGEAERDVTLASWQQQAQATLGKARQDFEGKLASHRTQLVQQFREQVKPFARDAARRRGLSIIVTRNESVVFDFVDAVDITDDVVQAIRGPEEARPLMEATPPRIAQGVDAAPR
jgi:Skp family chaperone for outer membrane proteins